ncbi:MFS transporter [Glutamicibacter nicotianae]|uniref:MFS transporter n=1 Tax=Glutamicibacter nicotianae TaxID=37929 RepID=UPI000EF937DD|nr:MFS transporter [Glutamicibacter nicotianae]
MIKNLRYLPLQTLTLVVVICIGYFVDSAIYLLLLLSTSAQDVSWWVTAVVLANLIPPIVFAPVLGWVVDRISGKGAWVAALTISGLSAIGIAFFESPVLLVALAAIQAICAVVISAAIFKLLPLAPKMNEKSASSLAVGIGSVAAIGGPPLAALTASADLQFAFILCGSLLLGSAAVALLVVPRHVPVSVEKTAWHEVWIGTKSLRSMTLLKSFLPVILGVVFVTSMEGVAGVFYLQEVAGSSLGYAILLSAWAVGSLIGALYTGRKGFNASSITCVLVGGLVVSTAILLEGIFAVALIIGIAFIIGGFGNAYHNIGIRNLVYEAVPGPQQGQVWSVVGALFSSVAALGNFFGTPGFLGDSRTIIIVAGCIGVCLVMGTLPFAAKVSRSPVKQAAK